MYKYQNNNNHSPNNNKKLQKNNSIKSNAENLQMKNLWNVSNAFLVHVLIVRIVSMDDSSLW